MNQDLMESDSKKVEYFNKNASETNLEQKLVQGIHSKIRKKLQQLRQKRTLKF